MYIIYYNITILHIIYILYNIIYIYIYYITHICILCIYYLMCFPKKTISCRYRSHGHVLADAKDAPREIQQLR